MLLFHNTRYKGLVCTNTLWNMNIFDIKRTRKFFRKKPIMLLTYHDINWCSLSTEITRKATLRAAWEPATAHRIRRGNRRYASFHYGLFSGFPRNSKTPGLYRRWRIFICNPSFIRQVDRHLPGSLCEIHRGGIAVVVFLSRPFEFYAFKSSLQRPTSPIKRRPGRN